MDYEWDPAKAKANLLEHGVDFADAVIALEDELALVRDDPDAEGEERFVSVAWMRTAESWLRCSPIAPIEYESSRLERLPDWSAVGMREHDARRIRFW